MFANKARLLLSEFNVCYSCFDKILKTCDFLKGLFLSFSNCLSYLLTHSGSFDKILYYYTSAIKYNMIQVRLKCFHC